MSDLPYRDDDPDDPEDLYEPEPPERGTRGRALWGFLALAAAAGVIVALMVAFLKPGGGNDNHHQDGLAIPPSTSHTTATTSAPTPPPSTPANTPTTATSSGTSSSAPPARTSCPTSRPCVSDGDPGNVIAAINAYRSGHGASTLPGSVSADVQKCALSSGDSSACPSNYSWEPVTKADGADVVKKIASRSGGTYLLDPRGKQITVGWAYIPGSHSYSCAIVIVT